MKVKNLLELKIGNDLNIFKGNQELYDGKLEDLPVELMEETVDSLNVSTFWSDTIEIIVK